MGYTVFVVEKLSTAREYQKTLNVDAKERKEGCIEGFSSILNAKVFITWCFGHACVLAYPEVYNKVYKKWSLASLPFTPGEYQYEVVSTAKRQFETVKDLFNRNDLEAIYYAGEPSKERLLSQMLIRQLAGHKKEVLERVVWGNSNTDEDILQAISRADKIGVYREKIEAAFAGMVEEYLITINFTRALSCKKGNEFNEKIKADTWKPISVGRVMSWMLGAVIEKEKQLAENSGYEVTADIGVMAKWQTTSKSAFFESPHIKGKDSFVSSDVVDWFVKTLKKNNLLEVESVSTTFIEEKAPLLFNLTDLQVMCADKYALTPDEVNKITQSLCDKKLISYPKTKERRISRSIAEKLPTILNGLVGTGYKKDLVLIIAKEGWYKSIDERFVSSDIGVLDQTAIIPTGEKTALAELGEMEAKIFYDIVDRFLCIFYPAAVYKETEVVLSHSMGENFYAKSKVVETEGYLQILNMVSSDEDSILGSLTEGQELTATFYSSEAVREMENEYTVGTLLCYMESLGIGTYLSRAAMLKKLKESGYITIDSRMVIHSTQIGKEVYDIIESHIPFILDKNFAEKWEKDIECIEYGSVKYKIYLSSLENHIREQIAKLKGTLTELKDEDANGPFLEELICPLCKKGVIRENGKAYYCSGYADGCTFNIWKVIASKQISRKQLAKLVTEGKTGVINGFKSKTGKTFDAAITYDEKGKPKFASE